MELEDRIVVDEVEHFLRPQDEAGNDLARIEVLARAGEHSGFDQRNQTVGNHLAVSAQVLAIHEQWQYRIRYAADAGLQHRSVFDQAGDMARDGHMQAGDYRLLQCAQRARGFHDRVNVAYVDKAVAIGARHLVVDLRHHVVGQLGCGQRHVHTNAEAAKAMSIGRR